MATDKSIVSDKQFVFNADNIDEIIEKQSQGFALPRYMNPWFKNQIGVRKQGAVYGWTQFEIDEFTKCALDIHYFANNYCHIKSEDGQVRQMKLRDYQYGVLDTYTKNRFTLNMSSRQTGKTITASISILHFTIFNVNRNVMVVANKAETVIEILDKIKNIYKLLPFFLKPGLVNWNNRSMVFENGCRIKSQARSKEPAIGFTIDYLYMDEFAHIPRTIIEHYYKAAIPTVSSIKGSKIIITSTPNGNNLFKDLVMGAQLPEGHPDKNMYKLIKVLWWQVPDGKFEDGTTGTRYDAKVYPMFKEMKTHGYTINKLCSEFRKLGFKISVEVESTETGDKEFIRILYNKEKDSTHLENVKQIILSDGTHLIKFANVSSWEEQEIKLIGGQENFNQEYECMFVAGSKRVLAPNTAKDLETRCTKYSHSEVEVLSKRLRFTHEHLRFAPDYVERDRDKYYWVTAVDVSEGLGQDDSVINGFRLMIRPREWFEKNTIKSLYDAFYLKQTFVYNYNRLDHKTELPELFYLLHFDYLNPEKTKCVAEYNGPGMAFISALPGVFESNNDYGNHIFVRYNHNQKDTKKKPGLKVSRNKKQFVKTYIDSVESEKLYVDEEDTIGQIDNFIKVETRSGDFTYKADGGNDDIVMTCVDGCTIFETMEYKNMCTEYYKELSGDLQNLIDRALDLEYNPEAISYKGLTNALNKNRRSVKRSGRYTKR